MSAIRLVSDVLAARTKGDPVPVLVQVTDWHPDEVHPFDWLAGRLARDHRLGKTVRWVDGNASRWRPRCWRWAWWCPCWTTLRRSRRI